jgi:hypothetical protein
MAIGSWKHYVLQAPFAKNFCANQPIVIFRLGNALTPPAPCRRPRHHEKFWGQLGTAKTCLSAFSCAHRLARVKNETRILSFIYGLITHIHARKRSAVARLQIALSPPLF